MEEVKEITLATQVLPLLAEETVLGLHGQNLPPGLLCEPGDEGGE